MVCLGSCQYNEETFIYETMAKWIGMPFVSWYASLRANNDETLPYAPDTLGKQESQSWQKTQRIVSIRLQTFLAPLAGASATAR